jgi:hypothetical protein
MSSALTVCRRKSLSCPRSRFRHLRFPVARRARRLKRLQEPTRCIRYIVDRTYECSFVRFRRSGKSTQFANELQSGCANFFLSCWRLKIEECTDVSAHLVLLQRLRAGLYRYCIDVAPGSAVFELRLTSTGLVAMLRASPSDGVQAGSQCRADSDVTLRNANCSEF